LALVAVSVTWPIALALGSRAGGGTKAGSDGALAAKVDQLSTLLHRMSDQQLLSDRAKHIAYRDKERDALRRAIQEDIARQDWDGAMKLADDIEEEFGYKAEADRFRQEIRQKCEECARKQLDDGLAAIDRHTRAEQWNNALREAEKLLAAFPDHERVRALPQEIETRRQGHKRQLLESWHEAVARHDVDGSIEILKQLDTYLTPKEAEGLQETARGIFREKLNSLGKQFAVSVQEHRWHDALSVGDQIVRDFPNTRIAQEVREKMDVLRKRATEPAAAAT
jgi:outer membrane protein assembly factor BamD (BamD/ComL family)